MVVHHHHNSSSTGMQGPGPQLFWRSGTKGQRGMRTWKGEDKGLFSVPCSFNYFHFHDDENADKCALNQNINQNITVVGIDP